jgi:hypothetical protein
MLVEVSNSNLQPVLWIRIRIILPDLDRESRHPGHANTDRQKSKVKNPENVNTLSKKPKNLPHLSRFSFSRL